PPAAMISDVRPQALEHGFSRFFDLQEQRSAVAAHKQADGAEGADASHSDNLEGDVLERAALDEATPLRRKTVLVGGKYAFLVDPAPRVPLSREMINERRPVLDTRAFALHQVREVIVLLEMSDRLGNDGRKLLSQRTILDALDF